MRPHRTLLIILVLCYIFAILGMEIFANNPEEYGDEYAEAPDMAK